MQLYWNSHFVYEVESTEQVFFVNNLQSLYAHELKAEWTPTPLHKPLSWQPREPLQMRQRPEQHKLHKPFSKLRRQLKQPPQPQLELHHLHHWHSGHDFQVIIMSTHSTTVDQVS
jgi:hypothetical protein